MTGRRIVFSAPPKVETVTLALLPVDRWSRRPVGRGVSAALLDTATNRPEPDQFIENRSGHLILLNRPRDRDYTIRIRADQAGYLDPEPFTFHPTDKNLERSVLLDRAPTWTFDDGITLLRGQIKAVPGSVAEVTADPDSVLPGVNNITVLTDELGSFALPIRLPRKTPAGGIVIRVRSQRDPDIERRLSYPLQHGRAHGLDDFIDLPGTNVPGLFLLS